MSLEGPTSADGSPRKAEYTCSTCMAKFDDSKAQRAHMRGDRHIYNLKRRIDASPPLSEVEFIEQSLHPTGSASDAEASHVLKNQKVIGRHTKTTRRTWQKYGTLGYQHQKSRESCSNASIHASISDIPHALSLEDSVSSNGRGEVFSSQKCLFCALLSTSLDANLTHMSHTHGFFIPNAEYLVDMESFLSYLFVIISIFHECLFCGKLPKTKLGAQDHMRGAGHCKLNMEHDETHFSQFYDFLESLSEADDKQEVKRVDLPALEKSKLFLPSGRVVSHHPRVPGPTQRQPQCLSSRSPSHRQQRSIEAIKIPGRTSSTVTLAQAVAVRSGTSTSLIGLSEFQRRALLRVELNIEKTEARTRNEYQSKVDKGGNKQKTYRVCSMGKKAGGLEKRLG